MFYFLQEIKYRIDDNNKRQNNNKGDDEKIDKEQLREKKINKHDEIIRQKIKEDRKMKDKQLASWWDIQ